MDSLIGILRFIGTLGLVVLLFNLMIAVHEWGHFLAGRWRGLYIDRFQIWFGKPIWKKTINGVQYGLGWIPLGGFVSLPQMAPMEGIEGDVDTPDGKPLAKVSPLDKIIVAFAGPLFSFLLAVVFAVLVWQLGYKKSAYETTEIGFVADGSPASVAEAFNFDTGEALSEKGFKVGDLIRSVDGTEVTNWMGPLDTVMERIPFSTGETIEFVVDRPSVGKVKLLSGYSDEAEEPLTFIQKIFKRAPHRKVGIWFAQPELVVKKIPDDEKYQPFRDRYENTPFSRILVPGDVILSANGEAVFNADALSQVVERAGEAGKKVTIRIRRNGIRAPGKDGYQVTTGGQIYEFTETPVKPESYPDEKWNRWSLGDPPLEPPAEEKLIKPGVVEQIKAPFKMVWRTLSAVVNPKSSIGVGHMSSVVGISDMLFQLLSQPDGWRWVLWFTVIINVNLAILNLLPLPVLDGGHITMAIYEKIMGRPLPESLLRWVMNAAVLLLLSFMLFVSMKDVGAIAEREGSVDPLRFKELTTPVPELTPVDAPAIKKAA